MAYDFAVVGNGWNRELFYTCENAYRVLAWPGGGLLVAALLRDAGFSVALAAVAEPAMTEHIALDRQKGGAFSLGRSYGTTEGAASITGERGDLLIVWDEGMDGLSVPHDLPSQTGTGRVLWASSKRLPPKGIFEELKGRVFLMLSADVLRVGGALISRQISWERAATELVWQLRNNPKFESLLGVPDMLVTFAEDGAVHITQSGGEMKATLTLLHGGFEGQLREESGMDIPDTWAVMVAAAAKELKGCLSSSADARADSNASPGETLSIPLSAAGHKPDIAAILRPAAHLLKSGYVPDPMKDAGFEMGLYQKASDREPSCDTSHETADQRLDSTGCAAGVPDRRGLLGLLIQLPKDGASSYRVPVSLSKQQPDPDYWCAANSFGGLKIQDLATQYVLEGSQVIEGMPRFSCGALITIDRQEIEAFQNIRGLIVDYAASKSARPLSIAVFGAPGSGKSFGVTQIAKSVLPSVAEKLEFNVSQMTSQSDLATAFHQVRDVVLSGKLPIVFFDEFDSDRDGRPLGWLKSFLMPMQDGKFRDESGEHPTGQCILVFAGGTSASFEDFCRPMSSALDDPKSAAFKNAKGPDFVSRLRGTINVLGPNPATPGEQNYILRRALLLRSLLERKLHAKGSLPVSADVLRAMLMVPRYKHGARSMEAVLDMSRMEGVSWEPVSLPFYAQLSLHVDADAFIRLVLRDVILSAYSEVLAKAVHEDYLAQAVHESYLDKQAQRSLNSVTSALSEDAFDVLDTEKPAKGSPYTVPWEELDEETRDSNREQALDIPNKLLSVGCDFDSGDTPHQTLEAFTEDEILRLAQDEHIRWMAQKERDGWEYAPVRDNANKKNPCLVPWEDLPPEEQQKDIDAVENIIPLLRKAGLRVYRMA